MRIGLVPSCRPFVSGGAVPADVALVLQITSRIDSTPEPYVKPIHMRSELWVCQANKVCAVENVFIYCHKVTYGIKVILEYFCACEDAQ